MSQQQQQNGVVINKVMGTDTNDNDKPASSNVVNTKIAALLKSSATSSSCSTSSYIMQNGQLFHIQPAQQQPSNIKMTSVKTAVVNVPGTASVVNPTRFIYKSTSGSEALNLNTTTSTSLSGVNVRTINLTTNLSQKTTTAATGSVNSRLSALIGAAQHKPTSGESGAPPIIVLTPTNRASLTSNATAAPTLSESTPQNIFLLPRQQQQQQSTTTPSASNCVPISGSTNTTNKLFCPINYTNITPAPPSGVTSTSTTLSTPKLLGLSRKATTVAQHQQQMTDGHVSPLPTVQYLLATQNQSVATVKSEQIQSPSMSTSSETAIKQAQLLPTVPEIKTETTDTVETKPKKPAVIRKKSVKATIAAQVAAEGHGQSVLINGIQVNLTNASTPATVKNKKAAAKNHVAGVLADFEKGPLPAPPVKRNNVANVKKKAQGQMDIFITPVTSSANNQHSQQHNTGGAYLKPPSVGCSSRSNSPMLSATPSSSSYSAAASPLSQTSSVPSPVPPSAASTPPVKQRKKQTTKTATAAAAAAIVPQQTLNGSENILPEEAYLNEIILPDTRIFAQFTQHADCVAASHFVDQQQQRDVLADLTCKTVMIGNTEHLVLDNANHLNNYRGDIERLQALACLVAEHSGKSVTIPAFLLLDDASLVDEVKEFLKERQHIEPIVIETLSDSGDSNSNHTNDQQSSVETEQSDNDATTTQQQVDYQQQKHENLIQKLKSEISYQQQQSQQIQVHHLNHLNLDQPYGNKDQQFIMPRSMQMNSEITNSNVSMDPFLANNVNSSVQNNIMRHQNINQQQVVADVPVEPTPAKKRPPAKRTPKPKATPVVTDCGDQMPPPKPAKTPRQPAAKRPRKQKEKPLADVATPAPPHELPVPAASTFTAVPTPLPPLKLPISANTNTVSFSNSEQSIATFDDFVGSPFVQHNNSSDPLGMSRPDDDFISMVNEVLLEDEQQQAAAAAASQQTDRSRHSDSFFTNVNGINDDATFLDAAQTPQQHSHNMNMADVGMNGYVTAYAGSDVLDFTFDPLDPSGLFNINMNDMDWISST